MADNIVSYGSAPYDTLIVFSKDKIVQVQASIIRECCESIAPLLTEEKGAKLNPKIPGCSTVRWRIDLVHKPNNPDNKYQFENEIVTEGGFTDPVAADHNETIDPMLLQALFDTVPMFYHKGPSFGSSLRPLVARCIRFLDAGRIFGAMPSVRDHLEKAIINCQDPVLPHIVEHPAEWLFTAWKLQSQYLCKEALIHLIGKWKLIPAVSRARIAAHQELREIVVVKLVDTWKQKQDVERQMLAHHPEGLMDNKSASRTKEGSAPGRSVYAAHIFTWIGLCLYRQWLGQMAAEGASLRAADGGYCFYTAISKGGDEYIKREELKSFYDTFPMTDKAQRIIETVLHNIKETIKEYVTDLVAHRAHTKDVEHLTSLRVYKEDLPWAGKISETVIGEAIEFANENPELGIWCPSEPDVVTPDMIRLSLNDLLGDYGLDGVYPQPKQTKFKAVNAKATPKATSKATSKNTTKNTPKSDVEKSVQKKTTAQSTKLASKSPMKKSTVEKPKDSALSAKTLSQTPMPPADVVKTAQQALDKNGNVIDLDATETDEEIERQIAAMDAADKKAAAQKKAELKKDAAQKKAEQKKAEEKTAEEKTAEEEEKSRKRSAYEMEDLEIYAGLSPLAKR